MARDDPRRASCEACPCERTPALAAPGQYVGDAGRFFKHGVDLLYFPEQVFRKVRGEAFNLSVRHVGREYPARPVEGEVLFVLNAANPEYRLGRVYLLGKQVKDFGDALVAHLLKQDQLLNLRTGPSNNQTAGLGKSG